jgi:hypothetical protein
MCELMVNMFRKAKFYTTGFALGSQINKSPYLNVALASILPVIVIPEI